MISDEILKKHGFKAMEAGNIKTDYVSELYQNTYIMLGYSQQLAKCGSQQRYLKTEEDLEKFMKLVQAIAIKI